MKKGLWLVWLAGLAAGFAAPAAQPTSCIQCHSNPDWIADTNTLQIVGKFLGGDVHGAFGLSCHDCHGGNPDPKLAKDMASAMDEKYQPNPYRGAPKLPEIPGFCGRCHSDPNYMRRFKPNARVDQLSEYWTSQHGQLLKKGDTNVATCVDCHSVHDIRGPGDAQSTVYPTAVAETCRRCHSDPRRMGAYRLPDGLPLPIDQYQRWRRSVHAQAMYEKDDLSAPTCNVCHGSHGAAPPNLASIVFVCGQCHGREAGLFRNSPKARGFDRHNQEYLPKMGKGRCAECHDAPEPAAAITNLTVFTECITCHGNHAVVSPRITMLGPLPETPCAFCHEGVQPLAGLAEPAATRQHYQNVKQSLIAQADAQGLAGDARFNWLVEQALALPAHRAPPGKIPVKAVTRYEFQQLFQKFRIGETFFTYPDPLTGKPVPEQLVRCPVCHAVDSRGLKVSAEMVRAMHGLTVETAQALRTLRTAQRGGVEVRAARLDIDKAVNAQIELQALVHSFSTATNSAFAGKQAEGLQRAQAAFKAGLSALADLRYRHRGLWISLGIILLVLAGLALKIREVSRRTPAE